MNDGSKVMSDRADALKELQAESEKIEIYGTITGPRVIDCNSGWDKETQPPTEARELDSIEKIWSAFEKIWKRATNQDMPVLMSIPANEDEDADCIMHRAILELETLRTTPTTREVLEELELALKENLAKWDKPLLFTREIFISIQEAIAKQLEKV